MKSQLYQSLRDGDESEVVKACETYTTDEISKRMPTMHDDTILHMAIYMRKESIALRIIEKSRQELITKRNKFGNTALHEAAAAGCVRVVEKLLDKAPDLLDAPNKKGERPLYTAAHFGHVEIFKLLDKKLDETLKKDPDLLRLHFCSLYPNSDDPEEYSPRCIRSTILHAAIRAEFFELALWIAKMSKYEKTVQIEDKDSKTPLQLLSSNSSAFESGMECGPIKRFIYNFNRSVWVVLRAWSSMRNIYEERKRHGLASELASVLIAADHSWDRTRQLISYESMNATARSTPGQDPNLDQDSDHSDEETTSLSREKHTPPIPLHIATEHGIFEIVKEILTVHKAAYEYRNDMNQNILHLSIMHRQWKIFDLVMQMDRTKKRLIRQLDKHKFTVLHYVGNMDYYKGGTQPGPAFQLQEELKWFEDVKNLMPPHYQKFCARDKDKDTPLQNFNKRYVEILEELSSESIDIDDKIDPKFEEEIPIEYFRRTHDPLLNSAREWLKRTSESCSTVAGLMATVAFTAAFTVPGGNDDQSGTPLLLHSPFFLVFVITDALSLASSLTSLVIFLSILTSPFELHDFRHSLPGKLILAFAFLFFSVVVTMLAFASTLMLTIPMKKRMTKIFIYCVAFLPVSVFALLQFPLWVAFKKSLAAMQTVWRSILSATHRSKRTKTAKIQ